MIIRAVMTHLTILKCKLSTVLSGKLSHQMESQREEAMKKTLKKIKVMRRMKVKLRE